MSFKMVFLFLALGAIFDKRSGIILAILVICLFVCVEVLQQFWYRGIRGTFLRNYFEIGHWPGRRCRLKIFSSFSSGSHFV